MPPPADAAAYGDDIRKGFVYKRVPHVTLKSIANNPDIKEGMTREQIDAAIASHAETETLYDQPYEDKSVVRVTGPFTVESLSPHRMPADGRAPRPARTADRGDAPATSCTTILDNLRKAGVQNTKKGERLDVRPARPYRRRASSRPRASTPRGGRRSRVAVCVGPEFGTVGPELLEQGRPGGAQGRRLRPAAGVRLRLRPARRRGRQPSIEKQIGRAEGAARCG